jgi:hypothetical protein
MGRWKLGACAAGGGLLKKNDHVHRTRSKLARSPSQSCSSANPAPAPLQPGGQIPGAEKKLVSGILAILLGSLGIHKFYLGY